MNPYPQPNPMRPQQGMAPTPQPGQPGLVQGMQGLFGQSMMPFWAGLAFGGTKQDQGRLATQALTGRNELEQNQNQFTASQAQEADQFGKTLAQRQQEFQQGYGLDREQFDALERYRQFQMETEMRKAEARPSANSVIGKINDDLRNGIISQDQADAAIAKANKMGGGMKMRLADGTEIAMDGDLSGKVQGNVQQEVISTERTLGALADLKTEYKPEYLTYGGAAKGAAGHVIGKAGFDGGDVTAFGAERKAWTQKLDRVFNQYKKQITGAAASAQEMQQIRDSIANSDMSPQEFTAAMTSLEQSLAIDMAIHKRILSQYPGIGMDTPEFDSLYSQMRASQPGPPEPVKRNTGRILGVTKE